LHTYDSEATQAARLGVTTRELHALVRAGLLEESVWIGRSPGYTPVTVVRLVPHATRELCRDAVAVMEVPKSDVDFSQITSNPSMIKALQDSLMSHMSRQAIFPQLMGIAAPKAKP